MKKLEMKHMQLSVKVLLGLGFCRSLRLENDNTSYLVGGCCVKSSLLNTTIVKYKNIYIFIGVDGFSNEIYI